MRRLAEQSAVFGAIVSFSLLVCAAAAVLATVGPGAHNISADTGSRISADYSPDQRVISLPPLDDDVVDEAREDNQADGPANDVGVASTADSPTSTPSTVLPPLILNPPGGPTTTPGAPGTGSGGGGNTSPTFPGGFDPTATPGPGQTSGPPSNPSLQNPPAAGGGVAATSAPTTQPPTPSGTNQPGPSTPPPTPNLPGPPTPVVTPTPAPLIPLPTLPPILPLPTLPPILPLPTLAPLPTLPPILPLPTLAPLPTLPPILPLPTLPPILPLPTLPPIIPPIPGLPPIFATQ